MPILRYGQAAPANKSKLTLVPRLSRVNIILLVVAALLVSFGVVSGVALEKYRALPARAFDHVLDHVYFALELHRSDVKELLANQFRMDSHGIPLNRDIDLTLLPLNVRGVRLSDTFQVPKVAGGITSIANTLVVVDRLGGLYAVERSEPVRKLDFPPLPNNVGAYAAANGWMNPDNFRAYSIVFMKATDELAVSHEIFDAEHKGSRMAVSLIKIDPETLTPQGVWRTIFKGDLDPGGPTETGGGRLAADAYGNLYLTIGVYQITGTDVAQSDSSLLGKIVKLDVAKGTTTIVSKGHRNPQGLLITEKGEIWSTEHGPAGGDELNQIAAGANYGWPRVTLGTDYGHYSWKTEGANTRHEGYQLPVYAWVPSVAISNLIEVKGFDARWNGDLLVSSLKAQSLYRLRFDKGHVLYSEPIWIGQRIRDIAELADGTIALWTDAAEVLFISVDKVRLASNQHWPSVLGDTAITSCMLCHHFGPTGPADPAPSLSSIFDRKIASDNYRYSVGLRNKEGKWTEENLKQFLTDPDRFASGTSMPARGLTPAQIDEVVAMLKSLDDASQQH